MNTSLRRCRPLSILALLLTSCMVALQAAPPPSLTSAHTSQIVASPTMQTFTASGNRFQYPMKVYIREASVSTWTPLENATPDPANASKRFTWRAVLEDGGSYRLQVRNPDNKTSNQLTFTVTGSVPALSIYCPATQTVISPDGQPFAVTFPMPSTTGGAAPITVTTAPVNGSLFPVGNTLVTGTAVDAIGAQQTCTFTVSVVVAPPPPTATCDQGINLNANILLDGADVLEWIGTSSAPCIVNGNHFRIMVDGNGSWTGRLTIKNAVITGLGTATLYAIGNNAGSSYAYLNGATVDVQDTTFHQGGGFNFYSVNGASVVWRHTTYAADNLVPAGNDSVEAGSWFTETGSSTAPKSFAGNTVGRAFAYFGSPNWTVGAPKGVACNTGAENRFIGPRVGFGLLGQGSYASCYYVHVNIDVTPQKDYWSQVGAIGPIAAGAEVGPGIARTGHWVYAGTDGQVNDAIIAEASGHDHIRIGNGGRFTRPLILATYAGCARYSQPQYQLPASVGVYQNGNALTVTDAVMDLRGPDGAVEAFHIEPGVSATLTHTGEAILRLGTDTSRRGPLPWGTAQAGTSGRENAGFPFNDEDLSNGTSTLQDWIDYFRWVYAPAGSGGTAPRLAQTNQRPAVSVGPALTLPDGTTEAQLCGSAADDRGVLSTRWTVVSGPSAPTFTDPTRSITRLTGLVPGTYVIRLTATDGTLSTARDQTITVPGQAPQPQPGSNTIWLDPTTLARLKAKAAANDPDWVTIKAKADDFLTKSVAPFAVAGCTLTTICYEWQGSGWYDAALYLGLAYQVTGTATYAAKVRELMAALALPAKSGDLAPISTDHGYPSRTVGTAVAWGYAWTGSTWPAQLKTDVFESLNKWHDWMKAEGFAADGVCCMVGSVAVSNYFGGHVMGLGMAGLATRGDNPRGQEIASYWRAKFDLIDQEFTSGVYAGGYPIEGYVYGLNQFFRLIMYAHAVKTATGDDLMSKYAPLMIRNLFYNLKPNRWQWTDEANYSGDYTGLADKTVLTMLEGVAPPPWNGYVKYLRLNMAPVPNNYGDVQPMFRFIFGDPSVPATDYHAASSLVYHSPGDGHLYVRSDWTDTAVWSSFMSCSCHLGGHAMRAAGHIAMQRGTDYLLVNAGQWKGTDGVGGMPYAFDLRSKETNTLWFNNPWDPDYDGGQGWWGSQTGFTKDYQETPTYVYARADLSTPYTIQIATGLVSFLRSFVDLRNGTLVVFDTVKAGDPSLLKKIVWHVPPTGPRTIAGNRFTSIQGGSKLTIQTLLPANPALSIQPDPEYDGSTKTVTYRLEVSGANNATDFTVLSVLQATAASMTPPAASVTVGAQIVVSGIGKTLTFTPDGALVSVN